MTANPALLLIGHGSRSDAGVDQFHGLADAVSAARPGVMTQRGLIEFGPPDLDTGIDALVSRGATTVVAVPLVLLGAGHLKDDGPTALGQARLRHPGLHTLYAREIGIHPHVLEAAAQRARAAGGATSDAVVLVARGSTDPDANADLAKVARLLADGRGLGMGGRTDSTLGIVEPAFVSLAQPDLRSALERCHHLGAQTITVALYFLFTGVLPQRVVRQAREWAATRSGTTVAVGEEIGVDRRIAQVVWERYDQALGGGVVMNCDCCIYRTPLPGYEARVGTRPRGWLP
jgi:cobalt/nickel transport system ATP-binding protein